MDLFLIQALSRSQEEDGHHEEPKSDQSIPNVNGGTRVDSSGGDVRDEPYSRAGNGDDHADLLIGEPCNQADREEVEQRERDLVACGVVDEPYDTEQANSYDDPQRPAHPLQIRGYVHLARPRTSSRSDSLGLVAPAARQVQH